jgi:hypothetical protein
VRSRECQACRVSCSTPRHAPGTTSTFPASTTRARNTAQPHTRKRPLSHPPRNTAQLHAWKRPSTSALHPLQDSSADPPASMQSAGCPSYWACHCRFARISTTPVSPIQTHIHRNLRNQNIPHCPMCSHPSLSIHSAAFRRQILLQMGRCRLLRGQDQQMAQHASAAIWRLQVPKQQKGAGLMGPDEIRWTPPMDPPVLDR